MATPANSSYSGASGATLYCGRSAPMPAWMATAGVALNKLVAIPNSASGSTPAAGMGLFAFSGLVAKRDTCELFSAANGGHTDSSDNGVYSFGPKGQGLLADNPTWILRCAPTPSGNRVPSNDPTFNDFQPYDGKPTSRHSYDRHHYSSLTREIFVIGGTGLAGGGVDDVNHIHAYDVDADAWASPTKYPWTYASRGGFGMSVNPETGLLWTGAFGTFNPLTNTWTSTISATVPVRFPVVVANDLNIAFCLQIGDGWTDIGSPTINASKVSLTTKVQTAITFNASAAYSQFVADLSTGRQVAGMDYDSANGVFYWYQGQAGQENHLYKITPNAGSAWDMELFSFASGSATMTTQSPTGFCGRIKYFPLLKGVVLYPIGPSNSARDTCPMYFLKTSA